MFPSRHPNGLAPHNVKTFCWEEEKTMKLFAARKVMIATMLTAAVALSACTSDQVIDNSVSVATGTTKLAAKGVVGAGKLAYKGGQAIAGGGE